MAWPITDARIAAGAPGATGLFKDLRDELASVAGVVSGQTYVGNAPAVPNGSFEADADGTPQPTSWSWVAVGTGTGQVTNTQQYHGNNSFMAQQSNVAGNGGVVLTSSVFPVSSGAAYNLDFSLYAQFSGVEVIVQIKWLNAAGGTISTQTIVDFGGGVVSMPTAWSAFSSPTISPPNLAVNSQLIFQMGTTAHIPGSSTDIYLDNVAFRFYTPFTTMESHVGTVGTTGTWTAPNGITKIFIQYSSTTTLCESVQQVIPGTAYNWNMWPMAFGPFTIADFTANLVITPVGVLAFTFRW